MFGWQKYIFTVSFFPHHGVTKVIGAKPCNHATGTNPHIFGPQPSGSFAEFFVL